MRCFLLATALGITALARVEQAAAGVSFTGGLQSEQERGTQLPAQGYCGSVAVDLGPYFSIGANYSDLRTDPFNDGGTTGRLEYTAVGGELGAGIALADSVDLSATAGYSQSTTRGLDDFSRDPATRIDGPSGSLTLTYRASTNTELSLGPAYSYVGREPGWDVSAGLGLQLFKDIWLDGGYWIGETKDGWSAVLRADFGS